MSGPGDRAAGRQVHRAMPPRRSAQSPRKYSIAPGTGPRLASASPLRGCFGEPVWADDLVHIAQPAIAQPAPNQRAARNFRCARSRSSGKGCGRARFGDSTRTGCIRLIGSTASEDLIATVGRAARRPTTRSGDEVLHISGRPPDRCGCVAGPRRGYRYAGAGRVGGKHDPSTHQHRRQKIHSDHVGTRQRQRQRTDGGTGETQMPDGLPREHTEIGMPYLLAARASRYSRIYQRYILRPRLGGRHPACRRPLGQKVHRHARHTTQSRHRAVDRPTIQYQRRLHRTNLFRGGDSADSRIHRSGGRAEPPHRHQDHEKLETVRHLYRDDASSAHTGGGQLRSDTVHIFG